MNRKQTGFGLIVSFIVLGLVGVGILIGWQLSLTFQHKGSITAVLNNLHLSGSSLSATVSGTVTEGPTTPVCMLNTPCDRPVANHTLEALDTAGNVAAQTTTAADGSYTLRLSPGHYTLVLVPKLGMSLNGSRLVAASGSQTHDITVDSGIR